MRLKNYICLAGYMQITLKLLSVYNYIALFSLGSQTLLVNHNAMQFNLRVVVHKLCCDR